MAQEASTGIVADRFSVGVGPLVMLAGEGAETTPVRSVACAFAVSVIGDPVRLKNGVTGIQFSEPVRRAGTATFGIETGIWRTIAAAVLVPITVSQTGDRLRSTGVDDRPLGTSAGGDLAVRGE